MLHPKDPIRGRTLQAYERQLLDYARQLEDTRQREVIKHTQERRLNPAELHVSLGGLAALIAIILWLRMGG